MTILLIPRNSDHIGWAFIQVFSQESQKRLFQVSSALYVSGHGSCGQRDVEERAVPIDEGVKQCVKKYELHTRDAHLVGVSYVHEGNLFQREFSSKNVTDPQFPSSHL